MWSWEKSCFMMAIILSCAYNASTHYSWPFIPSHWLADSPDASLSIEPSARSGVRLSIARCANAVSALQGDWFCFFNVQAQEEHSENWIHQVEG